MKVGSHYGRSVTGSDIKAYIVTVPPEMRCQLSYFLTKKQTGKDLLQRRMIIHNDHYLEDVESSANNICMRSSSSRGYEASIGSNASGEWSWLPIVPTSYSSLFTIITTLLSYIEMNHFSYTR